MVASARVPANSRLRNFSKPPSVASRINRAWDLPAWSWESCPITLAARDPTPGAGRFPSLPRGSAPPLPREDGGPSCGGLLKAGVAPTVAHGEGPGGVPKARIPSANMVSLNPSAFAPVRLERGDTAGASPRRAIRQGVPGVAGHGRVTRLPHRGRGAIHSTEEQHGGGGCHPGVSPGRVTRAPSATAGVTAPEAAYWNRTLSACLASKSRRSPVCTVATFAPHRAKSASFRSTAGCTNPPPEDPASQGQDRPREEEPGYYQRESEAPWQAGWRRNHSLGSRLSWKMVIAATALLSCCGCEEFTWRATSPTSQLRRMTTPSTAAGSRATPKANPGATREEKDATVVDNSPQALKQTRELAARARPTMENVLRLLRSGKMLSFDLEAEARDVAGGPARLIPVLQKMVASNSEPIAVRVRSASLLQELGGPLPDSLMAPLLKAPDPTVRMQAVLILGHKKGPIAHPALLSLLDDAAPRVRTAAIDAVATSRVPGHIPRLVARMQASNPPAEVARAALALAGEDQQALVIGTAVRVARSHDLQGLDSEWRQVFQLLMKAPSAQVRAQAEDALGVLVAHRDLPERRRFIALLTETCTARSTAVLQTLSDEAKDLVSRWHVLQGRVRAEGATALQNELLAMLTEADRLRIAEEGKSPVKVDSDSIRYEELTREVAWALATLPPGKGTPKIIEALRSTMAREKHAYLQEVLGVALWKAGGKETLAEVQALARRLSSSEDPRAGLAWMLEGRTLDTAMRRLVALGVIDAAPARSTLEAWQRQTDDDDGKELANPRRVAGYLAHAGRVLSFDTETGVLPVRHDRLLKDLAHISGGALRLEDVSQHWLRSKGDDEDAPYDVAFICGTRAYRFQAENRGDWYDVESVVRAANRALADNKSPLRFVMLDTGDQTAEILFARPEAIRGAIAEGLLCVESSTGGPVQRGKDFEDSMKRRLQKEGAVIIQ